MPWLGDARGDLVDWSTQKWVEITGRRVDLATHDWLKGPVGLPTGVAQDFFNRWAESKGLCATVCPTDAGVLPDFNELAGEDFDATGVNPAIKHFYQHTADYEMDVWSEWSSLFKPFGWLVAVIFSRRLKQLNLPLAPLDASLGMTSQVVQVSDPQGKVVETGWVRTLRRTKQVAYVGSYSTTVLPNSQQSCVKTVFPLPNGNAIVLLAPRVLSDGSLELVSEGKKFGDPGFYFTVHRAGGRVTCRHLRQFRERLHVYQDDNGQLRADHYMTLWRMQCLHLHYRIRKGSTDKP